ncbi:MAG: hypothetical protein EOO06_01450 [Chitinophagaceae bacterium]|nr:MAG: hypothetical protein EOO06_01450 [Chitinophagaceae bacterium]
MIQTKAILFLLLAAPANLVAQQRTTNTETILDDKVGDLDRDGMEERVIVLQYPDSLESDPVRELRIFKRKGKEWMLWHRSFKAILPKGEGGFFEDPFEYIEIENGMLTVRQSGGTAWKWGQTDQYKYRNGQFELIAYTSLYGKPCEYWAAFNYNVPTCTVRYRKQYETCANKGAKKIKARQEYFKYRMKNKLTLETRYLSYTTITCPRSKQEIVF